MVKESHIAFGSLDGLGRGLEPARRVIVTDPEIRRLYGPRFPSWPVVEVERGEAAKGLSSVERLYSAFLDFGLDRGATVVAIGGGSVSDLAGFAAATWLRGVDFGIVPTTLLSMADASVGGKNGVDFHGFKNLVGTIARPRFVLFDVSLLSSLPAADFASGMAEVVKHGVLEGEEHFSYIENCRPPHSGIDRVRLEGIVERSVRFKSAITLRDERESGERRMLNLGHTIGHAVEAVTGLAHGFCVSCGLAAAFRLAVTRYGGDPRAEARVLALLEAWGLPTSLGQAAALAAATGRSQPDGRAFREMVASALPADKKRRGSDLHFVLPLHIGEARMLPLPLGALRDFVMEAP
jgi:3-dehydroquinate synthase